MKNSNYNAYIIVPIYNIQMEKELINDELISGYHFIYKQQLKKEYFNFIEQNTPIEIFKLLEADLNIPNNHLLITRSIANYVLLKRIRIKSGMNRNEKIQLINDVGKEINNILLSLRLIKSGKCQINKCYIFGENFQTSFGLSCSSNIEYLGSLLFLDNDFIEEDKYIINNEVFLKNYSLFNNISKFSNILNIPLSYFNQYYNSFYIYDRIIKLAIVLESILLSENNQELKYRLCIKACSILKTDCFEIFKTFYDIRSTIVHGGELSDKIIKKLIKFVPDYETETFNQNTKIKILYTFINKIIAELVRKILLNVIELCTINKIHSLKDLDKYIDENIIKNISDNSSVYKSVKAD